MADYIEGLWMSTKERDRLAGLAFGNALLWVLIVNVRADRFYRNDLWALDRQQHSETVWGLTIGEIRYMAQFVKCYLSWSKTANSRSSLLLGWNRDPAFIKPVCNGTRKLTMEELIQQGRKAIMTRRPARNQRLVEPPEMKLPV